MLSQLLVCIWPCRRLERVVTNFKNYKTFTSNHELLSCIDHYSLVNLTCNTIKGWLHWFTSRLLWAHTIADCLIFINFVWTSMPYFLLCNLYSKWMSRCSSGDYLIHLLRVNVYSFLTFGHRIFLRLKSGASRSLLDLQCKRG